MTTKVLDLDAPGIVPEIVTVEVRGSRFTFRELDISEYDKLVKAATHQEADDDGIMQDVTDSTLLLRLMIPKSCIDPKLTPDIVAAMGSRGYRALARIVNELHYGDEPVTRVKDDETPAEETPKGNA
jgi:hypothetical protein